VSIRDKKTGFQTRTGGDAEEKTSLRRRNVTISGPTYSGRYDDTSTLPCRSHYFLTHFIMLTLFLNQLYDTIKRIEAHLTID